jgi:3'-phosphoadenosine 5'-phosphosulfate sulfotransferase (PAPS reductase)/FAD synthetase
MILEDEDKIILERLQSEDSMMNSIVKSSSLRVLSLGAGVQSTTLALMIEHGEVPMVDCGIFADTQNEPQKVMEHLDWLEKKLSYPIYRVTAGDLKKDILNGWSYVPFHLIDSNGKKGINKRQCTFNYKIKPINKKVRELLGYKKGERVKKNTKVEMVMGISYDEMIRMKRNPLKYIQNVYPLVDKDMRRHHCLQWMEKNNYPKPFRSACWFCPYHSNKEWRNLKENHPREWQEAIKLDKEIREKNIGLRDTPYLHKDRVPLNEADLDPNKDQQDLFNDICDEGMCGV